MVILHLTVVSSSKFLHFGKVNKLSSSVKLYWCVNLLNFQIIYNLSGMVIRTCSSNSHVIVQRVVTWWKWFKENKPPMSQKKKPHYPMQAVYHKTLVFGINFHILELFVKAFWPSSSSTFARLPTPQDDSTKYFASEYPSSLTSGVFTKALILTLFTFWTYYMGLLKQCDYPNPY